MAFRVLVRCLLFCSSNLHATVRQHRIDYYSIQGLVLATRCLDRHLHIKLNFQSNHLSSNLKANNTSYLQPNNISCKGLFQCKKNLFKPVVTSNVYPVLARICLIFSSSGPLTWTADDSAGAPCTPALLFCLEKII